MNTQWFVSENKLPQYERCRYLFNEDVSHGKTGLLSLYNIACSNEQAALFFV
jgi:hypothetical protein